MAEEILFGIAEEILLKLGEQAVKQICLIWGMKAELLKLRKTVSTIQAVLLDAEEKKANNQVKNWLERLEDAVYDADNVVDEFRYAQLRRRLVFGNKRGKKVRIFFSKLNQFVFRAKMAHKIKNIRDTLDQINKDRTDFHFEQRREDEHHFTRLETDSFIIKDEVIGRDKDREKLLQFLLNNPESEENVSFMPMVGIGGLGKTTLAQLLFNHDEVQKHFELKAWVCVSVDFDVKALAGKIIESITRKSLDQNLRLEQLQNQLRGEIDGKKYLLVLDDIWNEDEEKWLRLKRYLMCGARGSKVLITTRSLRVAGITQTVEPHILEGLDKDMSWLLFKTVAFEKGKEIEDSSDLAKIGREILDKCRGVPLAIKTIGRLLHLKQLRSRNPEKEWMLFRDSKLATIDGQRETDILPTLKLSYDYLPSRLKHCFAFCSLFPEDHEINVEELIRLWIAEGFVKPSKNRLVSLEEVGYGYFVDLLWRSFFQEVEKDEQGAIISCKMHDLMHDLSISVAGKGVVMLDQISKDNTQKMGDSGSDISTKTVRHAYVHFGDNASNQIPSSLFEQKKLRTLLISARDPWCVSFRNANFDALLDFKFLRSFRLCIPSLEVLPYNLGELVHLRYLDLSNTCIKVLPDSITRLHHLETLILAGCYNLERLPQDMKKLVNLRHLELSRCWALAHMPHGIGELTSLRTLTNFVVADDNNEQLSRQSAELGELSALKNLHGKLEIQISKDVKDVALKDAALKDREHLRGLSLSWRIASKEIGNHELVLDGLHPSQALKAFSVYGYMGSRLSNWLSSLTNLVSLELIGCENLQYIPPLHCLSSLELLRIQRCNAMEYISEMDEDEFCASMGSSTSTMSFLPSLKQLEIQCCVSLKGWWRSMKSGDSALTPMPLQETIISAASSSSTPSNLEVDKLISRGDFSSLQCIQINYCPDLASLPKIIFNVPSLQGINVRQRNEFGSPDEIEAFLLNEQKGLVNKSLFLSCLSSYPFTCFKVVNIFCHIG
ncbi:hypothetical protein UlMin_019693 [Ulmus minor]